MDGVAKRIAIAREWANVHGPNAVLLCDSDPHNPEGCSASYRVRSCCTLFPSSAGYLLITGEQSVLWVDARYHPSALQQIDTAHIQVKLYSTQKKWLDEMARLLQPRGHPLHSGAVLYVNNATTAHSTYVRWQETLIPHDITVTPVDLRPSALPFIPHIKKNAPNYTLDNLLGVKTRATRLSMLRQRMRAENLGYFTHNGSDDINWMLNIRGWDVEYNQIALCYLLVEPHKISLYIRRAATSDIITEALASDGISVYEYEQYYEDMSALPDEIRMGIVNGTIRCKTVELLLQKNITPHNIIFPAERYLKTDSELGYMRRAVIKEGVAMAKLLFHIQRAVADESPVTESDVYTLHLKYRREDTAFLQESFPAIIACGAHAAEMHYNRSAHSDTKIAKNDVLLIDCGGHYMEGTTDITRVSAYGTIPHALTFIYTMVLKAHIALATAKFPYGATGLDIDLFARMGLWKYGYDYPHGTGHGIGFGLNVHDGPYSLSRRADIAPIEARMVFSNEPGAYIPNQYGIRIESLIHTVRCAFKKETHTHADSFPFMQFETLSLCPFDSRLIDTRMLAEAEIKWIDSYHTDVANTVAPYLAPRVRNWMQKETASLRKL